VSVAAQTFAGIKTFTSAIIASAGIQVASLFNTNGTGASDVGVKVGVSTASGSVNATAKLASFMVGIGGTEVEKASVRSDGVVISRGLTIQTGDAFFPETGTTASAIYFSGGMTMRGSTGAGASDVAVKLGTSVADASVNTAAKLCGVYAGIGGTEVLKAYVSAQGGIWSLGAPNNSSNLTGARPAAMGSYNANIVAAALWLNSDTPTVSNYVIGATSSGGLGMVAGTNINAPTGSQTAFIFGGNGVSVATIVASGRLDQSGTDSTGTPGAATINKPIGKSAIAAAASSVVITNSLVTATSHIIITPHARDTTCKELIAVPAAGLFTVSGSANATAALPFSWRVSGLL
jgi:hypothetical protein